VWLDEVVDAVDSGDEAALEKLRSMGIDPARCGQRLLHVCWWGFFEGMFFSELGSAGQVVVEPGGRLTFVSLGNTSSLSNRHRRLLVGALERVAAYDVESAVELILQLLMPMPPIDLHDFAKAMEGRIWSALFSLENPGNPWWERTGTAFWLAILYTAREYRVPLRLELSRMMQSACLYDHVAARLFPRLRLLREFRRYRDEHHRRQGRRAMRRLEKQSAPGGDGGALIAQAQQVVQQIGQQLDTMTDSLPLRFTSVIQKAAYSASQLLRFVLTWTTVGLIVTAVRVGFVRATSGSLDVVGGARWVVGRTGFYGVGLALLVLTIRRVLYRLGDVDRRDGGGERRLRP
jgi:predicted unusual protein kinase regulating ubiquinone biosynthesis (AarF/ABC1/UbiB family)